MCQRNEVVYMFDFDALTDKMGKIPQKSGIFSPQ